MAEDKGLVGKLNGVSIGDVIFLTSNETNLSGYVAQLKRESVRLSVEDPNKHDWMLRSVAHPFNPARWYDLEEFDSYEVLKKYEPSKE